VDPTLEGLVIKLTAGGFNPLRPRKGLNLSCLLDGLDLAALSLALRLAMDVECMVIGLDDGRYDLFLLKAFNREMFHGWNWNWLRIAVARYSAQDV
jgi:hypothetical protein